MNEKEILIKDRLEEYLRQKGIDTRKPFLCLNPEHNDRKPSMNYDKKRNKCHCFSCGADYSVIDLIGIDYGIKDNAGMFKKALELFGLDGDLPLKGKIPERVSEAPTKLGKTQKMNTTEPAEETSFKEFYEEARKHINETDYATKTRGLTQETIERFRLGYCESWRHPKAPASVPGTPRLIIPITEYSYLARDTRENIPEEQQDFKKSKVKGKEEVSWLFNEKTITESEQPIFILEGEIDAMSVEQAGGRAVAIGSVSHARSFLEYIEEHKPSQPLLLAFDNDEAGNKCTEKIETGLKAQGVECYRVNITCGYKDANEALVKSPESFKNRVKLAKLAKLGTDTATISLKGIMNRMLSGEKPVIIPTGFNKLDTVLNGGLRAGLYTIGAISSLGKTTFIVQVADYIAKHGTPVLYVSLEMARDEIVAKILSRLTYEERWKNCDGEPAKSELQHARTTTAILNTQDFEGLLDGTKRTIMNAVKEFDTRANELFILEGIGDITVEKIRATSQAIRSATGRTPVIFVDYLQILATPERARTDKQAVDINVVELKRLSRDEDTPVITVSSFNRDSYTEPVSLKSFKESGSVEYSSDVVIGLQYSGMDMDYEGGDGKVEKRLARVSEIVRTQNEKARNGGSGAFQDIQLKILKHRNGKKEDILFKLVPMFNYFEENSETGDNPFIEGTDSNNQEEWEKEE